jgi:hypothetical protein
LSRRRRCSLLPLFLPSFPKSYLSVSARRYHVRTGVRGRLRRQP